jgi:hypothetical protein
MLAKLVKEHQAKQSKVKEENGLLKVIDFVLQLFRSETKGRNSICK